jgi:hypothetical protein
MGLLDSYFDPSMFSGQGGLLNRLLPSIGALPQSAGFPDQPAPAFSPSGRTFDAATFDPQTYAPNQAQPISVGSYQMPRVGSADLFQPQQAALPANATPTQGQVQQAAPQPSFNPLAAGFEGFARNLHTGPIGAIIGGIGSAAGLGRNNQTEQALIKRGLDPALARTVTSDPALLRAVLPHVLGLNGQTDDIKEYQFAKQEDPSLTFEKFMARKKAVSGEFGMQPIWGTDANGKPAVLQLGKSGEAKQSVLPPGFSLARDPIKVEGPTGTTILDPQTRQQVGFIPKDVAGAQAAEKRGQAQGTAQAALANGADIDAEQTKKKIDDLLDESRKDGLASIVGPIDQFRGSWTLGQSGRDALARLEQLQGGAFLQAYSTLKGGGAITEMEGQKAEKAIARMQRSQSEDDFRQALKDFRDAIDIGLQKLRRAAAGGESPQTAQAPASPSTNLKAKYGLD